MTDRIVFVSGHLDLTAAEFSEHYEPRISTTFESGARFVVGDARGCDTLTQAFLVTLGCAACRVTVFHMLVEPRNNIGGFSTSGGYRSDDERDAAMTASSTEDIAWVRPGRELSGTAKNLARRR